MEFRLGCRNFVEISFRPFSIGIRTFFSKHIHWIFEREKIPSHFNDHFPVIIPVPYSTMSVPHQPAPNQPEQDRTASISYRTRPYPCKPIQTKLYHTDSDHIHANPYKPNCTIPNQTHSLPYISQICLYVYYKH